MPIDDGQFDCPNCGETVPTHAQACPSCGSDDQTGWSDDTMYDNLGLPDEAFGEEPARPTRSGTAWFGSIAVILVIVILVLVLAGVW